MSYSIEFDVEEDGRWIAEIPSLPGVLVYGSSKEDAQSKVQALALRVIADTLEREGLNQGQRRVCRNCVTVAQYEG